MRSKINIFNIYPRRRRGEAVAYERLPQSEVRLYTEICKFIISEFSSFVFKKGALGFRFCGFGQFLTRFFGFCAKRLRFFGFGVLCGLRVFSGAVFGFRFLDGGFSDFSA